MKEKISCFKHPHFWGKQLRYLPTGPSLPITYLDQATTDQQLLVYHYYPELFEKNLNQFPIKRLKRHNIKVYMHILQLLSEVLFNPILFSSVFLSHM